MKRSHVFAFCGVALAVGGYLGFPRLFERLGASTNHVEVTTAKGAAIHIATSDPETTLLVYEKDGTFFIGATKMKSNGDYVDGQMWLEREEPNLNLQFSQRKAGVVTTFRESDAHGFPIRKWVTSQNVTRAYQRPEFEWREVSSERNNGQAAKPAAATAQGKP